MLGIVFTEFTELVEKASSEDILEDVFDDCPDLSSGGAYTAVGKYDHTEILALVKALSERTGMPVSELVFTFGEHLFKRFTELYPAFFENVDGTFHFLSMTEHHIHVEVKKLYPQAELPKFDCVADAPDRLTMHYKSSRPFADLAAGLISGCIEHFGEDISVSRSDPSDSHGSEAIFELRNRADVRRPTA